MTKRAEKAFSEASKLPESQQDELAAIILDEILVDERWNEQFAKSQGKLEHLAQEAKNDYKTGKTDERSWEGGGTIVNQQ